ncbi:hypothetical protein [Halobaculum sp. MBLA0143]|uniref:hypothetical protein n=1 Tax=Halobaculum sp. MBLA0143 TaxID=3079933 RepID=UPI003525C41D
MTGDETETRDRGFLTPADREYLRGEREPGSVQSERNTRARVRDRTHEALYDFPVVIEQLEQRDREILCERLDGEGAAAFDALTAAVAFLHRVVDGTELSFETVLAEGINVAAAADDRAATVELDVTYTALTAETIRQKARRGESLSLTEVAFADESDEVDLATVLEADEEPTVDDGRIQARVTDF